MLTLVVAMRWKTAQQCEFWKLRGERASAGGDEISESADGIGGHRRERSVVDVDDVDEPDRARGEDFDYRDVLPSSAESQPRQDRGAKSPVDHVERCGVVVCLMPEHRFNAGRPAGVDQHLSAATVAQFVVDPWQSAQLRQGNRGEPSALVAGRNGGHIVVREQNPTAHPGGRREFAFRCHDKLHLEACWLHVAVGEFEAHSGGRMGVFEVCHEIR
ncbi:hypothetical protein CRM73_03525 [Kocuria sp. CCUG 69068]|nr:hypothetical protein [Kocuria sp. CCUG 69068]